MRKQGRIIDFHTHIMTLGGVEKIFPDARNSLFFKHVAPIVEPIADLTECVHDQLLRYLAMHYNNKLSRLVYSQCGELFLMEALRLFKRHGLDRLLKNMDRLEIEKSVIYSLEPLTRTSEILQLTAKHPGRFAVFASFSHAEPDPVAYLRPLIESGLVSGIKIHPMVGGFHAEDLLRDTRAPIALARDHGLPVSIHTGDIPIEQLTNQVACSDMSVIAPIIEEFPDCTFILNHLGWESWRPAIKLAKARPNVFVETSWQPARIIRRAVDALGRERVLFGSDYPMFQPWQALRELREALTASEFEMVAFRNAERILNSIGKRVPQSAKKS